VIHTHRFAEVRAYVIAAAVLALGASSLSASTLAVQGTNKNTGNFAARVGVGTLCGESTHLLLSNPFLPGEHAACSTLTSDADLATGATTFTAGDLVILRNGFSVATGATLTVEIDRALYPDAWVQDDTPDGEKVYSARFYVDPTQVDLELTQSFYHFLAFDGGGDPELRVGMKQDGSERRLFLDVFLDSGGVATTAGTNELELPDGWRWVEVGWTASTGANNGTAYLCVDQGDLEPACEPLASLDNDTGAIDFVRWGAVDVPSGSDVGNLDLDDFESRSSLLIGPLP
jgi:hypothetical protein